MNAIDLFAGLGGMTQGATQAGARVLWAANHWRLAVNSHARNHPSAAHVCQDLQQADWREAPAHDLLLASPCCQGHSTASRGARRAYHDGSRATAWAVTSCVEAHRPAVALVENVPAFREWALYPIWRAAFEALGYALSEYVVDAADFGVPQHRRRLFVVAARGRAPLRLALPDPTPWRPFEPHIRWNEGAWRATDSVRGPQVAGRLERGRSRFGERFLLQHVTNHPGRDLGRPIGTITTAPGHWEVVDGGRMRPLLRAELLAAQSFPQDYAVEGSTQSDVTELIGNAVPPTLSETFVRAIQAAA